MLIEFINTLDNFNSSNKEILAKSLLELLQIDANDLTNYTVIEEKIGKPLSDNEKYKLDMLYRTVKFNPTNYSSGGDCGEEEE